MDGNVDKLEGKAKQAAGKVTDNKELQAKGKVQETKGKLKGAVEKLDQKLDDTADK
jgi:uncharacterized protein YjbJ (UPF0337 family)